MKTIVIAAILIVLSGCVSLPSPQEAAAADYGPIPTNYEEIVKTFYGNMLKDPGSAQYRNISSPRQYWLGDRFTGAKYGYLVCVTLNGKNSYGAYVGFKTDGLLINNDSVVLYVPDGMWFGRQVC